MTTPSQPHSRPPPAAEGDASTDALARSLAMLRATLESTTDAICVTNANAEITEYNRRYLEIWNIPEELAQARDHSAILDLVSDRFDEPEAFRARVAEIYRTSPDETFDLLELKGGRIIERFSRTQWVEQRNVGRVWSFRDVTDRKWTERELREQTEWFRVTLGSIADAVITVDTRCRVTFLNPVAERLTGWAGTEALARPLSDVMVMRQEAGGEPLENLTCRTLETGAVLSPPEEVILRRRDGTEVPIEESAAPIENPPGFIIGAVLAFRDVTERRQREAALRQSVQAAQEARAAAEQASKAKDHFLAALSHELRTPLTPVLAILTALRDETELPPGISEDLETIRRNVELEARLIDDLLDLTRITRGKLHLHREPVSLERIVDDAVNTCLPDLRTRQLNLRRELASPAPVIHVDGARVTQILWNLLKNAIKFTGPGGTITVRSRIDRAAEPPQLYLEVQDTGLGLDHSDLTRIFLAFEQADRQAARQFGGLGLGLAISKAIADSHGGALWAQSEGKGHGSTFTLRLPCPDCPARPSHAQPPPRVPVRLPDTNITHRPLRILLVEDHVDTAEILSRLLRRMGHEVLHASTVARALEIAEAELESSRLDLLISDLGLPDGTGRDVVRAIAAKAAIPAIALSGYGMESDLEQSAAAGFSRHLTKPVDVTVLKRAIAELMHT